MINTFLNISSKPAVILYHFCKFSADYTQCEGCYNLIDSFRKRLEKIFVFNSVGMIFPIFASK